MLAMCAFMLIKILQRCLLTLLVPHLGLHPCPHDGFSWDISQFARSGQWFHRLIVVNSKRGHWFGFCAFQMSCSK